MDACPVCKTPYQSASSKYCSRCGMARPAKIRCEKCGSELEQNALYCDSCGTRTAYGKQVDKALGKE